MKDIWQKRRKSNPPEEAPKVKGIKDFQAEAGARKGRDQWEEVTQRTWLTQTLRF